LSQFGGFFFNWGTNRKLSDEFSQGPRNKEDDDGGNPPGYIPVILSTRVTQIALSYQAFIVAYSKDLLRFKMPSNVRLSTRPPR
jgi:hypothetical protein